MEPAFVSIIVPTLNRKEWLQEQIASLRALRYPRDRFELIVVDNGSSDGAWEWLQEALKDSPVPLKPIRNETPFKTHAGSRNVGLRHARGEIIAFTDSDCIVTPGWLSAAVSRFRRGLGIVVGKTIPPPDDPIGPLSRVRIIEGEKFFDTCNVFYSREAIDRVGGFAEDVPKFSFMIAGDDSDLGLRVKQAGYQSEFVEDAVVMHRVRQLTAWQWLIEPRVVVAVPFIIRRHSAASREMLFLRYFLTEQTALFDLSLLGLVLASTLSPWFFLLFTPYLWMRLTQASKPLSPIMRLVRLAAGSVRDMFLFLVLLYASIRFRCLVI